MISGRILLFASASLIFILLSVPSKQSGVSNAAQSILTINYCELRRTPELFAEKIIRVRAIYSMGFELSALYEPTCMDRRSVEARHETWVDINLINQPCATTKVAKILRTFYEQGGGDLEVTFIGKFHGLNANGYGHLSGSRFQIDVDCVEEASLLPLKQDGCSRIDDTERFHYIAYVRTAEGQMPAYQAASAVEESHPYTEASIRPTAQVKPEQMVWLRLVNNSSCPIVVPTASAYKSKAPDGTGTFELQDQAEVAVLYDLSPRAAKQKPRRMESRHRTLSVLPSGRSVYFSVPLRYFVKEHYDVRVSFSYPTGKPDEHYEPFYFSIYSLPEELREKMKYP